jgi:phage shock protein C
MNYPAPQPPKRLTRSRDDKVLAGVCGGLARYANLDPALVRILAVVLTLVTGGTAAIVYVVAVLVMPEADRVGPPPPPVGPRPPAWPSAGARPADPVWGREGAPWEQSHASMPEPPARPAPASAGPDPEPWPSGRTDGPTDPADPARPDPR